VIDLSRIDVDERGLADEITQACKTWGFFLVKNHPIPLEDIDEMFTLSKEFFALPEELKAPYPIDRGRTGYVGSFQDKNKDDKASMYFGGVRGSFNPERPSLPPYWYDHVETVERFRSTCHDLTRKLLRSFAISFGLEPDFFAQGHLDTLEPGSQLRLLHYPAREDGPVDGITRLIPHSDSTSVTLLFQQNPGLDVLSPNDSWIRAPAWRDHILINVGDAIQFWSGNQLKSTMHRVTFDGLPAGVERYSMAYFCGANNDTLLEPLVSGVAAEDLVGWDGKPLGKVTAGEYYARQFDDLYGLMQNSGSAVAV